MTPIPIKKGKKDEGSNGPSKGKKKFCRICKDAGQTFKRYTSHDASECKFKNKKADENKKLYSLLKKTEKRLKRLEKRKAHSDSDSSDSDWQVGPKLRMHEKSDALKARLLGPEDKLTYNKSLVKEYSNVFLSLENYLADNLFIYNERSFPAKIRRQIRTKVTHTPEVVAQIVFEKAVKNEDEKKVKNLRVLLDSGGSANLIQKRHVKNKNSANVKIVDSKFPVTWETVNGKFHTKK